MSPGDRHQHFTAVILKHSDFGEGHSSFTLLEKDIGKIEVAAFGSAREKSRRRSSLLVGNLVKGIIYRKSDEDRFAIQDADILETYTGITSDLHKLSYLYLLFEILNNLLTPETPFPLFDPFVSVLRKMDCCPDFEKYFYHFIIRFFDHEGYLPDFGDPQEIQEALITPDFQPGNGTQRFIRDILEHANWVFLDPKSLSISVASELLSLCSLLYRSQTGKKLLSLNLIGTGNENISHKTTQNSEDGL